jgi:hypothetical protein
MEELIKKPTPTPRLVGLRVTDEEFDMMENIAVAANTSKSNVARSLFVKYFPDFVEKLKEAKIIQ